MSYDSLKLSFGDIEVPIENNNYNEKIIYSLKYELPKLFLTHNMFADIIWKIQRELIE